MYDGPLKSLVSVSGQGHKDRLLAYLYYDFAKVTFEDLSMVADNLEYTNLNLDEVFVDKVDNEEAYISVSCTESTAYYAVSFEGNDKFAPFEVAIQFN